MLTHLIQSEWIGRFNSANCVLPPRSAWRLYVGAASAKSFGMMKRSCCVCWAVLALIVFCLESISASGAIVCVGPSATGNGSGVDWNNLKAWSGTPSRGDTWYLVDGGYAGKTLNTAHSGTTVITIKKATVAEHGGISTGWSDTLGDGQATMPSLTIQTGYWVVDGQQRNESNWFDESAYGIAVIRTSVSEGQAVFISNGANG